MVTAVGTAGRRPGAPALAAVALMVVIAFAVARDAEWWPVSSMRLFSAPRTALVVSWDVVAEAPGGERRIHFAELGRAYRGAHALLPTMRRDDQHERDARCQEWARAAVRAGYPPSSTLRVERVTKRLSPRASDATLVGREVVFRCRGAA